MRRRIVVLVGVLVGSACRSGSPAAATASSPDPGPGAGMGCGIRGTLLDGLGAPRFFTQVAAASLDRSSRVAMHSDSAGRFALPSECNRVYAVGGRSDSGVALGLVWVADGPVDVELQLPRSGDVMHVRAARRADALRLRVLELSPPTVLRPGEAELDRCDATTNELRRLRAGAEDAAARDLAGVALMAAGCSPCPGADESTALIGAITGDRGLAEAWPFGYGRLYACAPGAHPYEAKFSDVLRALDPEFAARVVFGRYVEAQDQADRDGAARMARLLDGPLADTDFVAGLAAPEDLVDR